MNGRAAHWARWLAIGLAGIAAGCATTLERPVEPFESETIELAPNASFESCVKLEAGDRMLFSYLADPPMRLAIRRQIGNAIVSYIIRDPAREDRGIFFVPETEEYCLHWAPVPDQEVTWVTLLRYSIRVNNNKP